MEYSQLNTFYLRKNSKENIFLLETSVKHCPIECCAESIRASCGDSIIHGVKIRIT